MKAQLAAIEHQIGRQNDVVRSVAQVLARLPSRLSLQVSTSALESIELAANPRGRRYPMVGYGIRC
jgi:hypothetical protein